MNRNISTIGAFVVIVIASVAVGVFSIQGLTSDTEINPSPVKISVPEQTVVDESETIDTSDWVEYDKSERGYRFSIPPEFKEWPLPDWSHLGFVQDAYWDEITGAAVKVDVLNLSKYYASAEEWADEPGNNQLTGSNWRKYYTVENISGIDFIQDNEERDAVVIMGDRMFFIDRAGGSRALTEDEKKRFERTGQFPVEASVWYGEEELFETILTTFEFVE